MQIGILTCGPMPEALAAEHGQYLHLYSRLLDGEGFDFRSWDVYEGDYPDGPDAADGWLVSGSRFGVYEDHAWLAWLMGFIRDAATAKKPMVGICFGHQAMAQALGGKVEKYPGGWALGHTAYDWEGETLHLNAWHQDQVVRPPEGAIVTASNAFCRYAALSYGPGLFSVQPHPEFGDPIVAGLIEARRAMLTEALVEDTRAKLGRPTDAPRVAHDLARVLKGGAPHV